MPTYSYQCAACGHEFDRFQQITEKPVKVCPSCSRRKVRRLISGGAGIIFKGSGFYQTDYRSEEYKSRAKADSDKSPASGKSDTSSKDSTSKKASAATAKD